MKLDAERGTTGIIARGLRLGGDRDDHGERASEAEDGGENAAKRTKERHVLGFGHTA